MKNHIDKTMISIGEASELLGVHVDTMRNWEKRGLLVPVLTPGRHRRYAKSEIEKLIGVSMTEKIVQNWTSYRMLDGVHEDRKKDMALALESQRIFNEKADLPTEFRRISIPLVRRALHTNTEFAASTYGDYGEPIVTDITWEPSCGFFNLDAEADKVAVTANQLQAFIEIWARDHGNKFKFRAFGVVDGRIAIYGLE
jgi:excisionase family DNA binding protein